MSTTSHRHTVGGGAPVTTPARSPRHLGPGWVPNQHGAWAMLAVPLFVGVLASRVALVHLPLAVTWFVGYFAFFATSLWLKSGRRDRFRLPMLVYAGGSAVAGLVTLAMRPGLILWAPLFVLPLAVGLWAAASRVERSLGSGVATVVGSALMAPVAYAAGDGTDWHRIWLLTAVVAGYFVGTLLYVKSVIRERGSTGHLALSVGYHAVATVAALWLSPWLGLLWLVLTLRAFVVPRRALDPRGGITPKFVGLAEIPAIVLLVVIAFAAIR